MFSYLFIYIRLVEVFVGMEYGIAAMLKSLFSVLCLGVSVAYYMPPSPPALWTDKKITGKKNGWDCWASLSRNLTPVMAQHNNQTPSTH